jgi:hypothetical protein
MGQVGWLVHNLERATDPAQVNFPRIEKSLPFLPVNIYSKLCFDAQLGPI